MRNNDGCAVIAALVILLVAGLFLGPLFMMLAWNYGVCLVIAAASVCWNYWAWFWVDIFIGLIGVKFYKSVDFNKD